MNITIKLYETTHEWCFFSLFWAVWSVFLRNYVWPETGKTREGDQACNLAAASRDLLHFKLKLTPKYWKSHLNGDGCKSTRFFFYLFAEFELHPSYIFRENRCWNHKNSFLNMIGAKLSDQSNSRHAGRFKSTNQRLAYHGSPSLFWSPAKSNFVNRRFRRARKAKKHHTWVD